MSRYPDLHYRQVHRKLPEGARVATIDDFNRPKRELDGMAYLVKHHMGGGFTEHTVCLLTTGLKVWLDRGLLYVYEKPVYRYTTENLYLRYNNVPQMYEWGMRLENAKAMA
jgi:hypothetical protein